jgi:hypothetical protein
MSHGFIEAVRASDWALALSILEAANHPGSVESPAGSLPVWLVEVNAPPQVVIACQRHLATEHDIQSDCFGLLEQCASLADVNENAYPTFAALLAAGASPNKIIRGGQTLFQNLVALNRVREVQDLLRFGVDPDQMNVFGQEGNSNRAAVEIPVNEAARIAHARFSA